MNLKRLWCLLVIIAFSMPAFAASPGQLDSFDNIGGGGTNWVETVAAGYGNYVIQETVAEVNEGTGSMKFDFTLFVLPGRNDEVIRTFGTPLDLTNYKDLAVTLWVWTDDPNDSRPGTLDSRLKEIILYDGSAFDRNGHFSVLPLKNVGWNKVVAPLRNFKWVSFGSPIHPNQVDWNDIAQIGLWARTESAGDHNAIYLDDMQLELAPAQPSRPYQVASFDDIIDEMWEETHGTPYMLQTPGGDSNFMEGSSSMLLDFVNNGTSWDLTPTIPLIPALDFTDGNDWSVTVWVWTDLVGDSYMWEIILHDVCGNAGRYRVPRSDINSGIGWKKITARIDEFLWTSTGSLPNMSANQACLDAIVSVDLYAMDFPNEDDNDIYLDDLRIETAVEAVSEAVVYNADRATITVDGDASDWAGLTDSDIIDVDLKTVPNQPRGDLHVKYRLAWDPNYLYILVEEQPSGDVTATEAPNAGTTGLMIGGFNDMGTLYDSLALSFDFTNNRLPGVDVQMGLWLFLGLSSTGQTDLMGAMGHSLRGVSVPALVANGSAATSGTLGSRIIEARLKWTDLNSQIDSWYQPVGGIGAAIQPGFIFGCDPRLQDREGGLAYPSTATHGLAWFTGSDQLWPQGSERWPTGRDAFSTDIRLVCSSGDIDFDCDVDFIDYAQFAKQWTDTGCNSVNDFCNGSDIVITGDVDAEDLSEFTLRWLSP